MTSLNPSALDDCADPSCAAPAAVLDAQALAVLTQLDPTGANRLIERIMATYLGSLERLVAQLVQARAADDMAAVKMAAHTLKSSSASIGALALSGLCASTEQVVRENQLDQLPDVLDRLLAETVRVDAAVRLMLAPRA